MVVVVGFSVVVAVVAPSVVREAVFEVLREAVPVVEVVFFVEVVVVVFLADAVDVVVFFSVLDFVVVVFSDGLVVVVFLEVVAEVVFFGDWEVVRTVVVVSGSGSV